MDGQQRQFVLIAAPEALDANGYVLGLSASLRHIGHKVEIWTILRGNAEPATEISAAGNVIRRFRGYREYSVPRVRPCAWVVEWVACATSHLRTIPDVAPASTLVTFDWEAGVAGRLLSQQFGSDLVHVPTIAHSPDSAQEPSDPDGCRRSCRREEEERETCRAATLMIATSQEQQQALGDCDRRVAYVPEGPGIGAKFVEALPFTLAQPRQAHLAIAKVASVAPAPSSTGRGPWLFASEGANYAFTGTESLL